MSQEATMDERHDADYPIYIKKYNIIWWGSKVFGLRFPYDIP